MRKLILKMSVSIDGFVGGPQGEIDWIFKSMDAGLTNWLSDMLWGAGVHIMGSRTYQDMVSYWPYSTDVLAAPMNEIPKLVFSKRGNVTPNAALTTRGLRDAPKSPLTGAAPVDTIKGWSASRVASGDLSDEITRLRREPGKDILAHGGASFARSLIAKGLVDEYRLVIHPVALGAGLPLFTSLSKPMHLRLTGTTVFDCGAVAHVYQKRPPESGTHDEGL